jgi:thiamine biosynthesis lipoprotein
MKPFAVFLLSLVLIGCSPRAEIITRHHQILAFGTIIEVTIRHHDNQLIDQALQRLESDFLTMHRIWHPWEPGTMTRTNQLLQSGEWFTAATSVLPLIKRTRELAILSENFFNPAIGKLISAWGFHRNDASQPFIPDMKLINALRADIPTMQDVEIEGISMRGLNPNIQVDLGGIAKGYAIDQATNMLRTMGITHAIINAGGDLKVIGQHDQRPWKIGIQHPRKPLVLASIEAVSDESIFTSGDYQRFYMQQEKRRHHIIDPRTGEPVSHTMAVTVIHQDATVADAAATALLAAGAAHASHVASAMGIRHFLLMTESGKLVMSRSMQQRLQLDDSVRHNTQILEL